MGTIRRSQGYYEECSTGTLRVLTRPFAHLGADHGLIAARRNARELEGYSRGAWRLRARSARAARRGRGRTHGSAGRMRCRGTCGALTRTPGAPREYPVVPGRCGRVSLV
jgi:hypothetical protein